MSEPNGESAARVDVVVQGSPEQRGRFGWRTLAKVGTVGALAAYAADGIFGLNILHSPVTVHADAHAEFDITAPEVLDIHFTGNICPVTAETAVDVEGSVSVNVGVGILGHDAYTQTLTVQSASAHVEGEVDGCARGEDISVHLSRAFVGGESQSTTDPTLQTSDNATEPSIEYALDIEVDHIFANGARVTNLGQPGSVQGGDMGLAWEAIEAVTRDFGEENFPSVLQELGRRASEDTLCNEAVISSTADGLKVVVSDLVNQVLSQLDIAPIPAERSSLHIVNPPEYENETASERASDFMASATADMPDGIEIHAAGADCAVVLNDDPVTSDQVQVSQGE